MNTELAALETLISDRAQREARQSLRKIFQNFAHDIQRTTGQQNLDAVMAGERPFAAQMEVLYESALALASKDLAYKIAAEILRHQDSLVGEVASDNREVIIEEDIPDDCD